MKQNLNEQNIIWKFLEKWKQRKLGWLEFRTEIVSQERVALFARINLAKAFAQSLPGGLTDLLLPPRRPSAGVVSTAYLQPHLAWPASRPPLFAVTNSPKRS